MSELESYFKGSKVVKELTPTDFDNKCHKCLKSKDPTIILFYAPWCSFCKKVKDVYNELGKKMLCVNVTSLNCEKYKEFANRIREDGPGILQGYPSICLFNNGEFVSKHDGDRDLDTLVKVCKKLCKS